MNFTDNGGTKLFHLILCVCFFGGDIVILSPSNWCESNKKYYLTLFGVGHCNKSKVLVTGVKVICQKFSWQQLVQGGGRMQRLFYNFYFIFYYYYFFYFLGGWGWGLLQLML